MNQIEVTGMIISATPIGECDRRLLILTKERGKISAFAKGARRPNSMLVGQTSPFVFGVFTLYEGRSSYTVMNIQVNNYFEGLRGDIEGAYYGLYFLELINYYTREGNEESETLGLLYQTLRALTNQKIPNLLIRSIFEIKLITIEGEGPEVFKSRVSEKPVLENAYFSPQKGGILKEEERGLATDSFRILKSTLYTLQYIVSSRLEKLYTFIVKEEVQKELSLICERYLKRYIDKKFKSLEILITIIG